MDKEDGVVLGNLPSVMLDSPTNLPSEQRALCINLCCNSRLIPNRVSCWARLFTDLKIAGLTQPQNC
jgi:hypothetical protein